MKNIELLKTFSEPQRLRIINLLQTSDLSVSELVEILSLSQSNVSHHLKILKNQGLIELVKDGSQKLYRNVLNPDLPESMTRIWTDLKSFVKDPPETLEDDRKLIHVLTKRENNDLGKTFNAWRKQQPDLVFTAEVALGGMPRSGLAVDIGCGTGDFFKVIENSFEKIIGVELSFNQLLMAKERISRNDQTVLLQSDATTIPIRNGAVNAVYFRMALRFINNPQDALSEAVRILTKYGKISIIDQLDSSNSLSHNFFKKFIKDYSNLQLIKYNTISSLFLCVLEKDRD